MKKWDVVLSARHPLVAMFAVQSLFLNQILGFVISLPPLRAALICVFGILSDGGPKPMVSWIILLLLLEPKSFKRPLGSCVVRIQVPL